MTWERHELGGNEEVVAAAIQAREWGFPRKITAAEMFDGYWFGLGDSVIWWLEDLPGFPDDQVVRPVEVDVPADELVTWWHEFVVPVTQPATND